ncbi:MAG: SPOR domain-containing protein [Treponema sp.]|jgi:cell division septation protein DedD|nr:SPOR domain-containing protein [Treponema sp.]
MRFKFMEKKKILLIAIITGVFLTAVILFPLILLSNSKTTATSVAVSPEIHNIPPASADVVEMVTSPVQQRESSQNITINNYSPESNAVEGSKNPDGSVTINVLPVSPSQTAVVTQTPSVEAPPRPASEKPTVKPTPTPTRSSPPSSKPTVKPTPTSTRSSPPPSKPTPKQQEKSGYWIQAGSFIVKANAEKAKKTLDGEGIPKVVVENSAVKEQTVFRLRSGPHRTKEEAEFWLKLVKALGGFEESFVTER